jgi:hypothetical protein
MLFNKYQYNQFGINKRGYSQSSLAFNEEGSPTKPDHFSVSYGCVISGLIWLFSSPVFPDHISGYRIEEIENPLTRNVRYLDKLVDKLAKGRKMEKILRS